MRAALIGRALIGVLLVGALATHAVALQAKSRVDGAPREIAASELPGEARDLLAQIRAGGPFRYERDGVVFGNRERRLPAEPSGYYHEYTVPTPGARNRGGRRIVCGGPPTLPNVCYFTNDHYRSFRRIRE
jgi:ribonuclease T1